MAHRESEPQNTTTDFFELASGARRWLLQLSGQLGAIFLPEGLLDYKDIPSADAAPASPPVGRIREYWKDSVKQYKNSSGKVVRQLGFDQSGLIAANIIGKGTGATKTTTRIDGNTIAEEFSLSDEIYAHTDIAGRLDTDEDATLEIEWYPVGSEVGKLVTWQVDFTEIFDGVLVNKASDFTLTATDEASPATAFTHKTTVLTVVAANINADNGYNIRIKRIASSNDPTGAANPAIHHVELRYKVK